MTTGIIIFLIILGVILLYTGNSPQKTRHVAHKGYKKPARSERQSYSCRVTGLTGISRTIVLNKK